MILSIEIQNMENELFSIDVDKKTFLVDTFSKKVMINLSKEDTYEVVIKQKKQITHLKILGWIFWAITILLQGIFHVLTINNDVKWYEDVNPYFISARFFIEIKTDTELSILLNYENCGEWKRPYLTCKQELNLDVIYIPNLGAFSMAYVNYIKKVTSVSFLAIVIFLFFLIMALKVNNMFAIIICILLIGCILFIDYFLFKSQYDLLKDIQDRFRKTEDGSVS